LREKLTLNSYTTHTLEKEIITEIEILILNV